MAVSLNLILKLHHIVPNLHQSQPLINLLVFPTAHHYQMQRPYFNQSFTSRNHPYYSNLLSLDCEDYVLSNLHAYYFSYYLQLVFLLYGIGAKEKGAYLTSHLETAHRFPYLFIVLFSQFQFGVRGFLFVDCLFSLEQTKVK